MLTSLEDVVRRLIEGYDPDRIILFGSRARDAARPDSDIDLLIVKDTDAPPRERRMTVERLLSDRAIGLDLLVLTPREVRDLYATGAPLIEEIMESGRVLYMRRATEAWLRDAQDELDTAVVLEEHGRYRGACLHAQQCVEKALKAWLLERGKRLPRTHDVVELLNAVLAEGSRPDLAMEDAVFLNSLYRGRYPTEEGLLPHGEPDRQDAARAVRVAAAVLAGVRAEIETAGRRRGDDTA